MNTLKKLLSLQILTLSAILFFYLPLNASDLPNGFVYLQDIVPETSIELRYYTYNNFLGTRVDGYENSKCIISEKTALALQEVQRELEVFGLGLKVYDAYRPQCAVDHFIRWAKDLDNTKMKSKYYPDVLKKNLFKEGYIASKSSHSRGSTVDLTIIDFNSKEELDMGSGFDFFSPKSWPDHPNITASQRSHRMLLQKLMIRHGFEFYDKEWWHFTLKNEPFPKKYFNFPIK